MLYKVGDEVVLRGTWGKFSILEVDSDISGYLLTEFGWIGEVDIDHSKTAELHKKDKTLNHYTNELEKIVAEKNKVDIPADNIKPPHYRKGEVDLIESWYQTMPFDGFRWAMKSHIMKYVYRFEEKNGVEDLDKASYYIERLKEKELEQC